MVDININLNNLGKSTTLAINEKSNELLRNGREVYKFGLGQSPFPVPNVIAEELQRKAHEKDYLAVAGLEDLRIVIANYHSNKNRYNYSSSDIIIGPGSKELLFQIQFVLDYELILPIPSWVSYLPQAMLMNKKFHFIKSNASINWDLNTKELDEICQKNKKAKLLIINSPNNPSGTIFSNLDEIAEVAKKHNLIIISDEIYCELDYGGQYKSITHLIPEQTIINSGLSKWCGAGGWRIGYMVIPSSLKEVTNAMTIIGSETYTSVSAPIQYAAIKAFTEDHSEYLDKSRKILKFISEYIRGKFQQNGIKCQPAQGGFYMLCDFTDTKLAKFNSGSLICKKILEETGFAMLPGEDFGFESNDMLSRIAFVDFDGEKALKNLNDENLNDKFIEEYCPKIYKGAESLCAFIRCL